ncbi:MAG: hypothetical protein M1839_005332 [Geoglossum umbratile]|nr:MAG: hypothetical protein M1839_005332 [Geoglossum umbratile]
MSTPEGSTSGNTPSPTRFPCGLPSSLPSPSSMEEELAELQQFSQEMETSEDEVMEQGGVVEQKGKPAVNAPPLSEGGSETSRRERTRGRGRSRRSRGRGSGRVRSESSARSSGTGPLIGHKQRNSDYWRTVLGPGMSSRTRSSENR